MALIEPIPGQEERNADHLPEAGAAIAVTNLPGRLPGKLRHCWMIR
jgi:hypothetical protein